MVCRDWDSSHSFARQTPKNTASSSRFFIVTNWRYARFLVHYAITNVIKFQLFQTRQFLNHVIIWIYNAFITELCTNRDNTYLLCLSLEYQTHETHVKTCVWWEYKYISVYNRFPRTHAERTFCIDKYIL